MKMEIQRNRIILIPESEVEEAYIEEVLGLFKDGDTIPLKRVNAHQLSRIACLEIKRK